MKSFHAYQSQVAANIAVALLQPLFEPIMHAYKHIHEIIRAALLFSENFSFSLGRRSFEIKQHLLRNAFTLIQNVFAIEVLIRNGPNKL